MADAVKTKLTGAQKRALDVLASGDVSYTTWGGKVFTGMPAGIKNRGTLWVLHRLGLARTWNDRARTCWGITDAGRSALEPRQ